MLIYPETVRRWMECKYEGHDPPQDIDLPSERYAWQCAECGRVQQFTVYRTLPGIEKKPKRKARR